MIIKKLILNNYKRFALSSINKLEYTPDKTLQIILATNGAGKSSLVRECTPLPADTKLNYGEDGYKYIEIEHNNKLYKLSSGLDGKNSHSFVVDDIELNNVGLKKIQLQLVKEHFKITPHIHEILLGANNFTSMSAVDRKKWLTEISNIDYSYAISVYNKIKSRHRDITGAIKITQTKLLQIDDKILTDTERDKSITDIKYINLLIDNLLSSKREVDYNKKYNTIEEIDKLTTHIRSSISQLNTYSQYKNINVDDMLSNIKIDISKYEHSISIINNKLNTISTIEKTDITDEQYKEALHQLEVVNKEIEELLYINKINVNVDNIEVLYNMYTSTHMEFLDLLNNLSEYSDIVYNKDEHAKLSQELDKLYDVRKSINRTKDVVTANITTLEKHKHDDAISCGKCGHSWVLLYNPIEHTQAIKQLNETDEKLANIEKVIQDKNDLLTRYNNIANIISLIKRLASSNQELSTIYGYILNTSNIQADISIIMSNSNEVIITLEKLTKYPMLKSKRTDIENRISIFKSNNELKRKIEQDNRVQLEQELSSSMLAKHNLTDEYNRVSVYRDNLNKLQHNYGALKNVLYDVTKERDYMIYRLSNDTINNLVRELRLILSNIEKRLNDSQTVEKHIASVRKELDEYIITEKVLSKMVKELSPTEGLIAKSINSFLNVFVDEMNKIINSVWSYSIQLLPCSVSDDSDLDYKFAVKIDNDNVIKDISDGSSSMKEIIDLAFKIVFMKYLGITDSPLILDEFGITMDPVHRVNAFNTIDGVLANNFKQIFIISHFESMYGALTNKADINILNSNNLNIDKDLKYNACMVIS